MRISDWSSDVCSSDLSFAKRHDALSELVERVGLIGPPGEHVWRGVGISSILPTDVDRLTARIADLASRLVALRVKQNAITAHLELPVPETLAGFDEIAALAARVASAPALAGEALGNPVWQQQPAEIDEQIGRAHV